VRGSRGAEVRGCRGAGEQGSGGAGVHWWGPDAVLLVGLLIAGLLASGFLLGNDLYLYADNPGQFARLWFAADYTLPTQGRLIGWVPFWYAGSPELQFYPPGAVLLGLLIKALSLGLLPTVAAYQLTMVAAYLLPAITAYAFVRWAGFGRAGATLAGAIALTFPELWGGVEGVLVGMLGDRLAFALFPVAVMCGVEALDRGRRRVAWGLACGVVLSAIFLLHPFHVVAPWLAVLFYWLAEGITRLPGGLRPPFPRWTSGSPSQARAWQTPTEQQGTWPRGEWLRRAFVGLGLPVLVTLGLTAWWFVPLVAHSSFAAPALRANLDGFLYWLQAGQFPLYAVLSLTSLLVLRRPGRPRALVIALIALPVVLVAFIVFSYVVLIDRFGFYTLDPIRFIDEVYFPVLLLTAMGIGCTMQDAGCRLQVTGHRSQVTGHRSQVAGRTQHVSRFTFHVSRFTLLVLILTLAISCWGGMARFREGSQPRFLSQANVQYRLPELWAELKREPAGRVLITSSQVHFRDAVEDWPSYLMTTIPVFTGRETIGGTFHHWTPVAVTYWYGADRPAVMRELTHLLDDQRLFGQAWSQMDDAGLYEMCRRLDVTTVLCADDDLNARAFLDRSPRFQSYWNNGKFFLYRVRDYSPAVLDYDPAAVSARLVARDATHLTIHVDQATAGARLGVKITAYPLWQATAQGQSLPVMADTLGLMSLSLPAGSDYDLILSYREGPGEMAGAVITLISLVGIGGCGAAMIGKR